MNSQNILIHRLEHLHLGPGFRRKLQGMMAEQATVDQRASASGNYLPGLRAIESDIEAYFKDDFAWRLF